MTLVVVMVGAVLSRDHWLINTTSSVPIGIYVAAPSAEAGYVSFCLPSLPRTVRYDPGICREGQPAGRTVLKHLEARSERGLILRGDRPDSLDSRLFGPLSPALVRGYWRPLLTFGMISLDEGKDYRSG
ncbi:MAG: hypothetical protein OXI46_05605 [Gemmatimonadota bacterium]|nr:hypothetical protein [Gemmatimonadota bacterium]